MNYEEVQKLGWREALEVEGRCTIVKEIGEGWWLFENVDSCSHYGYSGILGWDYGPNGKNKFFAKYNPAELVKYYAAKLGYEEEKNQLFTDGRRVKWIARSFIPPQARDYSKRVIQQIGALDQTDIDHLERIHGKLKNLLRSGTPQHGAALKLAKRNREALKKKWSGSKSLHKRPIAPPEPENVSATVKLLNGKY
jgi:hypothetical protein